MVYLPLLVYPLFTSYSSQVCQIFILHPNVLADLGLQNIGCLCSTTSSQLGRYASNVPNSEADVPILHRLHVKASWWRKAFHWVPWYHFHKPAIPSDWIGLREILQETTDFPIKYGVFSCKCSLKPIHWPSQKSVLQRYDPTKPTLGIHGWGFPEISAAPCRAYGWDGHQHLLQLQLVQDCGLARCIQTHHHDLAILPWMIATICRNVTLQAIGEKSSEILVEWILLRCFKGSHSYHQT